MIPNMRLALIAPEPLLTDRAFVRIHNKAAKDAMRDVAMHHWKTRIPGHFQSGAGPKYGYQPRRGKYKASKERRYNETRDLVSGDRREQPTKDAMTRNEPVVRAGGRAANPDGTSGQLKLSIVLKFPFPLSQDENASGVSGEQMKREIAAITASEGREIAALFKERYLFHLNAALATRPRIRKRIEG